MTKFNFMNGKELKTQVMAITLALVMLLLSCSISMVMAKERDITIIDDYKITTVPVSDITVEEALKEEGITIGQKDVVNVSMSAPLTSVYEIIIERAIGVTVTVDGSTAPLHTRARTVNEAIKECGIVLGQYDSVSPALDAALAKGTNIVVTRRDVKTETVTEAIDFSTVTEKTSSLKKGVTKVGKQGQKGEKTLTYEVTYVNGQETARTLVSETVTKAPVNQVNLVGTATASTVSTASIQGTKPFSYRKALSFRASAYDPSVGSITASGRRAQVGVVAVDPRVIPLGTRLYIESADGGKSWVYGYCVAGDTGGAIKNNRVDLFYNSAREARAFGMRNATVYVLD